VAVPHRRVVDRELLTTREVSGHTALDTRHEPVADADVGERAPHHHLVVPPPVPVRVELLSRHTVLTQPPTGRAVGPDDTRRRDVVGGDAVAEPGEHARVSHIGERWDLLRESLEERWLAD